LTIYVVRVSASGLSMKEDHKKIEGFSNVEMWMWIAAAGF
jgi:hypothetical protein